MNDLITRLKSSLAEIEKHKAGWHRDVPGFGCQLCCMARFTPISEQDVQREASRVRLAITLEEANDPIEA